MASGPFLSQGAWVTPVTANDASAKELLGALRFENGKIYSYVKAVGAITAGFAVGWNDGVTGTSVATAIAATTATSKNVMGVAETTLTSGNFGWICVYGPTTAMCDNAVASGGKLVAGITAGMLIMPSQFTSALVASAGTASLNAGSVVEAMTAGLGSTAGTTATAVYVRAV